MQTETIKHSLLSLPQSLDKYKTVVDISDTPHELFKMKHAGITIADDSLNKNCDCIICSMDFTKEELQKKLELAKQLVNSEGIVLLVVSTAYLDDLSYINSFFRKNSFTVLESSIHKKLTSHVTRDTLKEKREHVFLLKEEAPIVRKLKVAHGISNPCTQQTCACNIENGTALPNCCYEHLKEMTFFLCNLFNENKITYWIDYGTLLGAARKKSIIPWDDDIDLSILASDTSKLVKLAKQISTFGYELHNHNVYNQARLYYSRINRRYVDIYTWKDYGSYLSCQNYKIDASILNPLKDIELNGRMVKCPNQYELYLEKLYGVDWREPYNTLGKVEYDHT